MAQVKKKELCFSVPDGTRKSGRSATDATAPLGMGATDTTGRLLASIFRTGPAAPAFSCSLDVRNGGVLLGLPGLLGMGLLAHTEYFALAAGYYRLDSIFLLLAFMVLARIKNIESMQ